MGEGEPFMVEESRESRESLLVRDGGVSGGRLGDDEVAAKLEVRECANDGTIGGSRDVNLDLVGPLASSLRSETLCPMLFRPSMIFR